MKFHILLYSTMLTTLLLLLLQFMCIIHCLPSSRTELVNADLPADGLVHDDLRLFQFWVFRGNGRIEKVTVAIPNFDHDTSTGKQDDDTTSWPSGKGKWV